jgi:hypothetical protein
MNAKNKEKHSTTQDKLSEDYEQYWKKILVPSEKFERHKRGFA